LILIEAIGILHPLYDSVLVPQTVSEELKSDAAPEAVRAWLTHPPAWFQNRPDPISNPPLNQRLDPGERAAIALALSVSSDRLLIDDWAGRVEAERRHLKITGTLGVLAEAHKRNLVDFEAALARLALTNFYLSPDLVDRLGRRLAGQS
jgi:predicted nucleic acid-binding protein